MMTNQEFVSPNLKLANFHFMRQNLYIHLQRAIRPYDEKI